MVKFIFQFPNSGSSLLEQLPYRAGVMMAFWWQSDKILKPVIILDTIDVMDLPSFWCGSIGIFPDNNMFKHLMPCISSWMVSERKKNIPITVFNSATLPIWVFFTLLIFVTAFTTLLRVSIHPTTTIWTNLPVSLGILIGITSPCESLLFRCIRHKYIITGETQLVNYLMRQKPHLKGAGWRG